MFKHTRERKGGRENTYIYIVTERDNRDKAIYKITIRERELEKRKKKDR